MDYESTARNAGVNTIDIKMALTYKKEKSL
jgi:hypothetical protein